MSDGSEPDPTPAARVSEVAIAFLRLGFTAFGGPAVHVAMMEEEFVHRRKWLDRAHFLDLVAAVNFIPGPNSTELAIHIGLIRAGFAGLITAGVCFITPAVLIILPIAWGYVHYSRLPQVQPALRGISAAVVAIVVVALIRLFQPLRQQRLSIILAIASFGAALALRDVPEIQPELIILATAAMVGMIARGWRVPVSRLPMFAAVQLSAAAIGMWQMAIDFLKIGATLFGSGYVLINYLQSTFVDQRHWLTQRQLFDAVAVGQFTPGPLLTTATFVGFLIGHDQWNSNAGGLLGAIVATISIFLPSFLFIALLSPLLQTIRTKPIARGALDAMNAAVVGLLAAIALRLGWSALQSPVTHQFDLSNLLIACAALLALLRGVNATWIIIAAGLIGAIHR